MGKVPTISINKTEGCHIYLSEHALGCEIVSAKSSEMNVLIPQDGDYVSTFSEPGSFVGGLMRRQERNSICDCPHN